MSKLKRVVKPDQKLTNFFPRRENGPTPVSSQSGGPPSSQPRQIGTTMPSKSQQSSNSRPIQLVNNIVHPRLDQEVISVSSGSQKSHISISTSNSPSVVIVSSTSQSPKRPRTRAIIDAVEILSPPRRSLRSQHLTSAISSEPSNSRSPSIQYLGSSQHPAPKLVPPPKPPKRKKKFESDSDISPGNSIIMVRPRTTASSTAPVSPRRSPMKPAPVIHGLLTSKETITSPCKSSGKHLRKKTRFDEQRDSEGVDLVPSSQSDEQELALPKPVKKDPEDIKVMVKKWRKETAPPDPPLPVDGDWKMDVDIDVPPVPDTNMQYFSNMDPGKLIPKSGVDSSPYLSSETEVKTGLLQQSSANTSADLEASTLPFASTSAGAITPLLVDTAEDPPPTPVALDAASKMDQIIAQIKENALAATLSSPDEPDQLLMYQQFEDSSDEEESDGLDIFASKRTTNGKGKR